MHKSIKIAATHSWLSRAFRQSSRSLNKVDWEPNPFLKAAKKGLKLELRCSDNWSCILLSKIFEIMGNRLTGRKFSLLRGSFFLYKGTLLTDKDAILKRWAEHFNSVLNRPSSVNNNAINRLPQIECNVLLDEFPTVTETRKAIQHLSFGKAPGTDAIPAEVYKAGGLPMAEKLTELFHCMWRKEAIPQDFKDASIIHLYKRKGNPQVCDNHRGISLLEIAGKILAKIYLNRLPAHLDQAGLIPESQCGFRKDRGTIAMIFTARQLQEKCQEQNVDLYMTFVDLTKAFDTVSRDGLWKIMAKFDCPPRYIAMVRQFHDGMQTRVQNDGVYSEPFPVTNGVKQGCVMAPTLFSMMFSAMLTDVFQDVDAGFPIRYRFDGLLNLRRLQAKSKVQTDVVDKLLYADDLAENAKSEEKSKGL